MLDGGVGPDATKVLKPILPTIMATEMREEESLMKEGVQLLDSLQYLTGTFLTAHMWVQAMLIVAIAIVIMFMGIPVDIIFIHMPNTNQTDTYLFIKMTHTHTHACIRRLGEVATKYGCSAILSHIHMLKDGTYVLNVANTGLGEAILCRSGRAVPLTTSHDPSTNTRERTRIADSRGFVSQVSHF